MQDICLSCYMRFFMEISLFFKKNRTFAPKCQIHMNTEQVWGGTEQEEIYALPINIDELPKGKTMEWSLPCDDAHTSCFCWLATIDPFLI